MKETLQKLWSGVFALVFLLLGCTPGGPVDRGEGSPKASGDGVDLQGAGATFPYPLYSKWVAEYQKTHPGIRVNYQSIGSGGGIRQVTERTVDFGASDAAMTDEELAKAKGKLFHIPSTLGAVVVIYNLKGASDLKLSSEVVGGIFLGEIKTWDDARIADLNPGVSLPKDAITVVHRTDGSGTTAVFTEYLAKVSAAWADKVGTGKSVKFPVGLGAKGNEGVAGQVKTTPNSIGYAELAYAKQTGLSFAQIKNRAGKYVEPSAESITAAAAGAAAALPDDLRMSIVDAGGELAYPIAAFSYILVYEEQVDHVKGAALTEFLLWALYDGQAFGPALHYAPLPPEVVRAATAKLRTVHSAGKPLIKG